MASESNAAAITAEVPWTTAWTVWPEYEVIRGEAGDNIQVAGVDSYEQYDPLGRPTLIEDLAALSRAGEQAILSFVRRNGLLTHSTAGDDVRLFQHEGRKVQTILALQHALQEASGSGKGEGLEDFLVSLIGPHKYRELREPIEGSPWERPVKATWREHSRLAASLASIGLNLDDDPFVREYGFRPDPGGLPPATPTATDRENPGAVARFLVADLLNAPRSRNIWDLSASEVVRGVPVRHLIETTGGSLQRVARFATLLDAIYWMLQGEVTGAKAVGICPECGKYFVVRDARQKFCPPPAGDPARQSLCGNRYRMRQRRRAQKGGDR